MPSLFDPRTLPPVTILAGHYGVGKTTVALNLAVQAAAAGRAVSLADLDVVNPYFRSSEQDELLSAHGIRLIAPAYAGRGTSIDAPALTGAILPAIEAAQAGEAGGCSGDADRSDPALAGRPLLLIDAGGDDAGAAALGRFSRAIAAGPYALLCVVNRFRSLTQHPAEAVAVLREIEAACRLSATAILGNSHLMGETTPADVASGASFAAAVAREAGLPLAAVAVPEALSAAENLGDFPDCPTAPMMVVTPYMHAPWGK